MNPTDCTVCFVIARPSLLNKRPSGTTNVVAGLVKYWGGQEKILVLCNNEFTKNSFLDALNNLPASLESKQKVEVKIVQSLNVNKNSKDSYVQNVLSRFVSFVTKPWFIVKDILHLSRYLKQEHVSTMYSHNGGYPGQAFNLNFVVAGMLANIRTNVLVIHNMASPMGKRKYISSLFKDYIVGRTASKIVAVSESCANQVSEVRRLGHDIGWIHNGINVDAPVEKVAEPSWHTGVPVVMFLGALAPRKGLDVLIRALSGLRRDWRLVIFGSGELDYEEKLRLMVRQYKLEERVVFGGFKPNASEYLQYCDLLVLPSLEYESFGMVILEAMSHKKPVVCSDFGGMKEVVDNNRTGLVVKAGEEIGLRDAIESIIFRPEVGERMGTDGYQVMKDKFDIRIQVENYKALMSR